MHRLALWVVEVHSTLLGWVLLHVLQVCAQLWENGCFEAIAVNVARIELVFVSRG